jgi:3-oxoacyl-[acyl-carrier protein] reductase
MSALTGKVALVTGSSRGIGASIARCFAREGARVVVHGRDEAALGRVRDAITRSGGDATLVVGDVTREPDVERMRAEVERAFGPLDILVTNAGGSLTKPAPFEEITLDGWRASIEGNLTATFLTIRSFLPGMKQRHSGNVITISSSAARRPHPQSPVPYAAAKAGIQMLTQHLAAQVGPFGIRVNCIAPETILTERNEQHIPAATQASLAASHPLKRLGTPDDVAEAALFLASARSAWITGMILDVAGGNVMV